MMNIIKRIVNIVLSASISIGCVGLIQYNYNKDFSMISSAAELDFKTNINEDGTITVYGYSGTDEVVVVPQTIDGKTVTVIGSSCFEENMTIKEAVLPNTIEKIEYKAFSKCKNLETINIPDSIETIGDYAFSTCHSLKSIDLQNVKKLGTCSFQLCISLEEIYVPGSVTNVVDHAFHGCHSLKTLTFGDGVKTIESTAVLNGYSVERILIPESVTEIGEYALGYSYYYPNYTRLDTTLYVYNNTAGLEYAKANGFEYEIIGEAASPHLTLTTTTTTTTTITTTTTTTTTPIVIIPDYIKGDVNQDNAVNSSDASLVLAEYSVIQTGGTSTLSDKQKKAANVNDDSKIDSADASKILEYYAAVSTGQIPSWN